MRTRRTVRLSRSRLAGRPLSRAEAPRGLVKFKRRQLIVDYQPAGLGCRSGGAVGIGEKRMRAVIQDPGWDPGERPARVPAPPQEFVAIQVSRLNEALLVAFSVPCRRPASGGPPGGQNSCASSTAIMLSFVANRLPEAPRAEALAEGPATYGGQLMCLIHSRNRPQHRAPCWKGM